MTSSLTNQSTPSPERPPQPQFFGKEQAANYDQKWAKTADIRNALQLLIRIRLAGLPADAHVLCVGVGTGSELLALAQEFPGWSFTAVEPSAPMLEICRERAAAGGIAARCTFHEGYLDSLADAMPFDGATCLLVSQFIVRPDARRDLFTQIASRLRPGGILVSADLALNTAVSAYGPESFSGTMASDSSAPETPASGASASATAATGITAPLSGELFEFWLDMQRFCDTPESSIEHLRAALGRDVAIWQPGEIAALIQSAGFEAPVQFFQALLIHGWYARRAG